MLLSLNLIMIGKADNTLLMRYWRLAPVTMLYGMYLLNRQTHLQSELSHEQNY